MCVICGDMKPGSYDLLILEEVESTGDQLQFGISRNKDGIYELVTNYWIDKDNNPTIRIPIDYCPFCGKELPRKDDKYLWKKES